MEDVHLHATPRYRPGTIWVEVDGEVVVVDVAECPHVLSPAGAALWPHLAGLVTIEELANDVAEAFGADRAAIVGDLQHFVRGMIDLGVLEIGFSADG